MTASPPTRPRAGVEVVAAGEAALVNVNGLVDEHFGGFGSLDGGTKVLIINVSGMTRMTSFGVRQWLKGMDALPKTIQDTYLLGCPTFFVDQLNMVLNFGGAAQTLTVLAPYACPACGVESGEVIDVLADRNALAKGIVPDKECRRCGSKLEFDETPESYFSFVTKYGASTIDPSAAQLLAEKGLYYAADVTADKPPRIIKLVRGSVTYFRIAGSIGALFRARPFLVGAEGEVVIDVADVERFETAGHREWKRLLKTLSGQVPAVTVVDVNASFLQNASDSFTLARNISVWSVLLPYRCSECGKQSAESQTLATMPWPPMFDNQVCSTCGGATVCELRPEMLSPLQKAASVSPQASAKLIEQRDEVLSRAMTDANVAQAGDAAAPSIGADDTILGKYKIVRRLSAGGMAEVFLAKQIGIGGFEKIVALKRIQRQLLETRHLAIDMFLNEAKIAGRLTHPNIVQVLDVGEVAGALYLAMEFVRGKDLRDIIKHLRSSRSVLPLPAACYIVREIAQALHYAYWSTDLAGKQLSVVHRDVSPHNVILGYDGTVKLLDFGVAMSAVTEQAESIIVGKWQYMSPEATMNQQIDHRSDLFSLGVIFYLLCTGRMPFSGSEPREIVKKIRAGEYKPLRELAPDIPGGLADLCTRLLASNPEERPQTGQEVATILTEITRNYGLESSSTDMARFIGNLFPEERVEAAGSVEVLRTPPRVTDQMLAAGSNNSSTVADPHRVSSGPMSAVTAVPNALGTGPLPRTKPSTLQPPMNPAPSAPLAVPATRPTRRTMQPSAVENVRPQAKYLVIGIVVALLAVAAYFLIWSS